MDKVPSGHPVSVTCPLTQISPLWASWLWSSGFQHKAASVHVQQDVFHDDSFHCHQRALPTARGCPLGVRPPRMWMLQEVRSLQNHSRKLDKGDVVDGHGQQAQETRGGPSTSTPQPTPKTQGAVPQGIPGCF